MKLAVIQGRQIVLEPRLKSSLKGLSLGDSLMYHFFDGEFKGTPMVFVEPTQGNPMPKVCAIASERWSKLFDRPIVFILSPMPGYERERLIDKDVYFIIADKYANLPMLVANECLGKRRKALRLTPVAQYLLLYHLQVRSINRLSAIDLVNVMPYSYESIALGLTCLADVGLCYKEHSGPRKRVVHFNYSGAELWEKAKDFMINPIDQRIHCDEILSSNDFLICGTNALAHYSWLNPDKEKMVMVTAKELKQMKEDNLMVNANSFDGDVIIESWKYPAIKSSESNNKWVDRLSLALSLSDNNDPRVEKEVERIINEALWKD